LTVSPSDEYVLSNSQIRKDSERKGCDKGRFGDGVCDEILRLMAPARKALFEDCRARKATTRIIN